MPASVECTTTAQPIKKNRAQLDHALFDVDFFHKPTLKALRRRFKLAGLVAYQEILFQISRATDAEIDSDTALASAEEFEIVESEEFLNYCFSQNLLQRTNEGKITQSRVAKDQEALAKKREKWRSDKRQDSATDSVPEAIPEAVVESGVFREQLNTEDLKKDLKLEKTNTDPGVVGKTQRAPLVYLSEMEVEAAIGEYMRFKLDPARAWVEEGIKRLSGWYQKNPDKYRGGKFAYVDLTCWAKDKCAELKTQGLRLKSAQAYASKATGKSEPSRPRPPILNANACMPEKVEELIDSIVGAK